MNDPANEDGGGHDAASALAFQIVDNASIDEGISHRLRRAFDGDTEACAALKLGVSITTVHQACRSGRPSARVMRRVCLIYKVEGTWLLTGEGPTRREPPPADAMPSEELLQEVASRLAKVIATLESARSSAVTLNNGSNTIGLTPTGLAPADPAPTDPASTDPASKVGPKDRHWL